MVWSALYYMTHYILLFSITWNITCCLNLLHDSIHAAASVTSITCSGIHYMLPESVTSITCSGFHYIHYMLLAAGPGIQKKLSLVTLPPQRSLRRPIGAISALVVSSPFPVGFILHDNIPARGNWCEVLAAGTRSWQSWSWVVQIVAWTSSAWNVQDVTAKYSRNPAKFKDIIVPCATEKCTRNESINKIIVQEQKSIACFKVCRFYLSIIEFWYCHHFLSFVAVNPWGGIEGLT